MISPNRRQLKLQQSPTWLTVLSELLRDWTQVQYLGAVTQVALDRGGLTGQKFRFQQAIAPDLYGPAGDAPTEDAAGGTVTALRG